MKVEKFRNLRVNINISTQKAEFIAICEEFGSNFPSLRIGEGWEVFRKYLEGGRDKKQIPILQKYLEEASCPPQGWDGMILERKNFSFSASSREKVWMETVVIPYTSLIDHTRTLVITRDIRSENPSWIWMMVDYNNRPSLAHKDGYIRLCEKLRNSSRNWVEINLAEEEITEEERDLYEARGLV